MIDISRCIATDGWLTTEEATYLAEAAQRSQGYIAEIGSWQGRSTCAIAANSKGNKVFAIDTWRGSPEHASMLAGRGEEWLFDEFKRNTSNLPVTPVRMKSTEAAALFSSLGIKFGMVFVDANHSYETVKEDLQAWLPLLTKEEWGYTSAGIICGHDYDPIYWPGVVQAVQECVPGFRVVPNTTIWTSERL